MCRIKASFVSSASVDITGFLRFKYLFLVLGMFCFIYHFTKKYLIKKEKLYSEKVEITYELSKDIKIEER